MMIDHFKQILKRLRDHASIPSDEEIFEQDEDNKDRDFDIYDFYNCKEQAYYAGIQAGRTEVAREVLEAFKQYKKV